MSASDIAYKQKYDRQKLVSSLEGQISSTKNNISRKQQELRSAPSYKHDCILKNIASSENSLDRLQSSLRSMRSHC